MVRWEEMIRNLHGVCVVGPFEISWLCLAQGLRFLVAYLYPEYLVKDFWHSSTYGLTLLIYRASFESRKIIICVNWSRCTSPHCQRVHELSFMNDSWALGVDSYASLASICCAPLLFLERFLIYSTHSHHIEARRTRHYGKSADSFFSLLVARHIQQLLWYSLFFFWSKLDHSFHRIINDTRYTNFR